MSEESKGSSMNKTFFSFYYSVFYEHFNPCQGKAWPLNWGSAQTKIPIVGPDSCACGREVTDTASVKLKLFVSILVRDSLVSDHALRSKLDVVSFDPG